MKPNSAKNTSVTLTLAALKRALAKKRTSSIGSSTWRSQSTNATSATTATAKPARITGSVQPLLGASMIDATSAPRPTIDSPAPTTSMRGRCGFRDVGTRNRPAMSATITIGTLTMNTDPHQKWSSRKPPATGPSATAMPATPDQIPIASARSRASVNTLVRIDSVAGMISAAPIPMTAGPDERRDPTRERGGRRRPAEDHQAEGEGAPAPEPVTQAAGGEQQPGEHQGVRVDHPLEVADAGAEVTHQRRERDVDDRVVDHDDEQAHAEDHQGEPAPLRWAVVRGQEHGRPPGAGGLLTAISTSCYNDVIASVKRGHTGSERLPADGTNP